MTWLNQVGGGSRIRKPSTTQSDISLRPHGDSFWGCSLFHAVQIKVQQAALSWGRNEMNSAQSPVFRSGPFPKSQKTKLQDTKQHLASAAWNSLLAVLGSGPFSIQFKTQFPAHHCRGGGNELSSVQSPVFETWHSFLQRNTDDSSSVAL